MCEGFTWRKSSYSGASGGDCVEVGTRYSAHVIGVRDTKNRAHGTLTVSRATWTAFVHTVRTR